MHTLTPNRTAVVVRTIALMLCCILCCSVFVMGNTQIAFCAPTTTPTDPSSSNVADDIGSAVESISESAYTTMRSIVIPLIIVWIAIAGFQFLLGGVQGSEKARKSLIAAIACLALVVFAPVIGKSLGDMFSNQGNGSFGSYNPLK